MIIKAGAVAGVLVGALLMAGMWLLAGFGKPSLDSADLVLKTAVPAAGAANIVCAVVLDIRGYDTLGEATLLFAAVTGVVVLLSNRKEEKSEAPKPVPEKTEPAPAPVPEKPPETKPPWVKDI